jgi:prefoldin subunit 5
MASKTSSPRTDPLLQALLSQLEAKDRQIERLQGQLQLLLDAQFYKPTVAKDLPPTTVQTSAGYDVESDQGEFPVDDDTEQLSVAEKAHRNYEAQMANIGKAVVEIGEEAAAEREERHQAEAVPA